MSQDNNPNPYAAPLTDASAVNLANASADMVLLKKFRQQIQALGGFWVFIGLMSVAAAVLIAGVGEGPGAGPTRMGLGVIIVLGVVGMLWMVIGVLTCLKQIWAVWVGLICSYLSLTVNLVSLNICPVVLLIVAILQAHRVLGWAKELTNAGVPLNAKPRL